MTKKIPILRVPFGQEDRDFLHSGLEEILDSGYLTMGKFTQEFERAFAAFTGAKHAVACSSGTSALEVILRGLGIRRSSVIVPTNTFLATAYAVLNSGNRVLFADSEKETLGLDITDVERRIAPDTKAVLLVHIGGIITPAVDALRELCEDRGIHLIEDAAHAHGSSFQGRQAGTLGTAGGFSFFPTKVLTTGEGGMVTTNDPELAERVRILRNHGKDPRAGNRMTMLGYNHRMSEVSALLGVQQMKRADAVIAERQAAARHYDQGLADVPGITPLPLPKGCESSYYKYVAYLDEDVPRDALKRELKEEHGVSLTGEVYSDLCHTEPLWRTHTRCGVPRADGEHAWTGCPCDGAAEDDYPQAELLSQSHVCPPVYPGLRGAELEHVVDSIRIAVQNMRRKNA